MAAGNARTVIYTILAMLAFAGNSVLCRLALREGEIDAESFTAIRLASGALSLLIIFRLSGTRTSLRESGSAFSALMLFLYAIFFSFAYLLLDAATGALILFAFVQATMIANGLYGGERPSTGEWFGWLVAMAGLAWLLSPGLSAPSLKGTILMALAGVAWGLYSTRGRAENDALAATTANFLMALLPTAGLLFVLPSETSIGARGVMLAITSGAITSGVGYVIWYAALVGLRSIQAAMVQLTVPAIAAAGGALLLAEMPTSRLLIASLLLLGGISIALVSSQKYTRNSES